MIEYTVTAFMEGDPKPLVFSTFDQATLDRMTALLKKLGFKDITVEEKRV